MDYWSCVTCGHLTQAMTGFCSYCSSPLPGLFNSPDAEEINRGVELGKLGDGTSFRLPLECFPFHFAFYGATGSGKTRLAMKLAKEAENSGITLLIVDVEGEWRNLIPLLEGETNYYAAGTNLKINPFEIGDIGLVKLLLKETIFKGIEVEYQELSPQMNFVLDACIQSSTSIPELIEKVSGYESSELPFKLSNLDKTKTALLVRLNPYKTNPILNSIFYCTSSSVELGKLDSKNIVIDVHDLEAKVAYGTEVRLILNVIALSYLRTAMARRPIDKTVHMFVVEEAQYLSPKILRKVVVTDTWATTEFATRLRKRGESLVVISQSPGNIETDIRSNAQNNFVFRLQSAEDVQLIARSFGYNWYNALDYLTYTLNNLQQRHALVKTPLVNEVFLIESEAFSLQQVSDRKLRDYMPKVEFDFTELETEFLESVNRHPFVSMTERRDELGWDKQIYAKVVRDLKDKKVIEQVHVRMGKSRPIVLYQPTGAKPSYVHEFYVHWIVDKLASKGIICRAEKVGPDIQIPKLNTCINVELGTSSLDENVVTALSRFDIVVIASDSKKVLDKVAVPESKESQKVLKSLVLDVPSLF